MLIFKRVVALDFLIVLSAFVFIFMPFSRACAQASCSAEMSKRAEASLIDARENWSSLLKHQKRFIYCDDGEIGEGYSNIVANLLAQKWNQLSVFANFAKKDPAFERWAIRHIDATASNEDLNKITINTDSCIHDAAIESLCTDIRQAAAKALTESLKSRDVMPTAAPRKIKGAVPVGMPRFGRQLYECVSQEEKGDEVCG